MYVIVVVFALEGTYTLLSSVDSHHDTIMWQQGNGIIVAGKVFETITQHSSK